MTRRTMLHGQTGLLRQREALAELGRAADRIYVDHGLTGTNRARTGLNQGLAAVRKGDTLVVPKLDRLARSVPDVRSIADELAARGVTLALGRSCYDPSNPMGKMFFNILATFVEFETDLIRLRTREGMAMAHAKGKLKGKRPKLSDKQQNELSRMHGPENIRSATWVSCSLFHVRRLIEPSLVSSVSDSAIWSLLKRDLHCYQPLLCYVKHRNTTLCFPLWKLSDMLSTMESEDISCPTLRNKHF